MKETQTTATPTTERRVTIDRAEFVKRIRTQADWIEAWDTSLIDELTTVDLDIAIRHFTANVERALRDARRRKHAVTDAA